MSASRAAETKTDNRSLASKVKLRLDIIDRAGFADLSVLDLCAGRGIIWREIKKLRPISVYVPCDREPRLAGTIKGDAERLVESFDLSRFNVIDVDTYGEPWECWLKIAARIKKRTAVFLTHGTVAGKGGCSTSAFALAQVGIPADWPVPQKPALTRFCSEFCLHKASELCTVEAARAVRLQRVTYYGLVCSGKKAA